MPLSHMIQQNRQPNTATALCVAVARDGFHRKIEANWSSRRLLAIKEKGEKMRPTSIQSPEPPEIFEILGVHYDF